MRENSLSVVVGQKVTKGQQIGLMGTTGDSTGQHLHLEIHPGGYIGGSSSVDPFDYFY